MSIPDSLVAAGAADAPFARLAAIEELPAGTMRRVTVGDLDLLLVHGPAGLCAIADRCPHMAAPLSVGQLEGSVLTCPLHNGRFDVATGNVVQFPTTGGLAADGAYPAPWAPPGTAPKPAPTDLKARARAATRVRRLRYYPLQIVDGMIEVRLPPGG
jgi:nitrite reductase/ring-hydroxylating ferredoxin subunit